jgi:hypothetical protein
MSNGCAPTRRPGRRRPRLTRIVDVMTPSYESLTKEEQWGQALRDLRFLYESGSPESWHTAVFTLGLHARSLRRPPAAPLV